MNDLRRARTSGGLVAGLILIGLGLLFLGEELRWLEAEAAWRFWPLVLVALGIAKLARASGADQRKGGLVLVMIGGWLLVNTFELFDLDWGTSWPLLLIGFGLIWTWEALAGRRSEEERHES